MNNMIHINRPHSEGTKQLFSNHILEKLSRTHIVIPLVIFTLISTGLIIYGFRYDMITYINTPFLFMAGMLVFSFIEYMMHRFVFHLDPKTPKREKFAYRIHGVHHDYPKDRDRLAMPLPLSLMLSILFFILYKALMGNLVYGFLPGFLMGYTSYLVVHYIVHAYRPPRNIFKILWVHHGIHHYKDPKNAFGVSSPLWDWFFGTMPK